MKLERLHFAYVVGGLAAVALIAGTEAGLGDLITLMFAGAALVLGMIVFAYMHLTRREALCELGLEGIRVKSPAINEIARAA
jgi:hypothetical protein